MNGRRAQTIAALGSLALTVAALVAPWLSHPDYSSIRHGLSELAGQNMPNAWIMRAGFVTFGAAVLAVSATRIRREPVVFGALSVFGAAMIAAAMWSHLPIVPEAGGSTVEDDLHSVAATVMGIAFAAGCGARAWDRTRRRVDWVSAVGVAVSVGMPLLMSGRPEVAGLVQRLMFLFSFFWIWIQLREPADSAAPPSTTARSSSVRLEAA